MTFRSIKEYSSLLYEFDHLEKLKIVAIKQGIDMNVILIDLSEEFNNLLEDTKVKEEQWNVIDSLVLYGK